MTKAPVWGEWPSALPSKHKVMPWNTIPRFAHIESDLVRVAQGALDECRMAAEEWRLFLDVGRQSSRVRVLG